MARKIPSEYVDSVARGAALLDKKKPGWARKIDLKSYTELYPDTDVLGQTFGSYEEGKKELKLTVAKAADLGFCGRVFEFHTGHEIIDLNSLWRKAINKRRKDRPYRT